VLQNVKENFSLDTDIPEMNLFYGIQSGIEAIHWEMYSLLIETLVKDVQEKEKALSAILHYPCIQKKAEWMQTWMHSKQPLVHRLLAFACAEGISFSSSFAGIFYFKKKQ
jgi:ribonucleotide reductase beta subunit family protein with ferritin-like domain